MGTSRIQSLARGIFKAAVGSGGTQLADIDVSSGSSNRIPLVGRNRELQELIFGLDTALVGRGCLFTIAGEPGIGKTRLADELTHCAAQRGLQTIRGRCWEAGGAPAYWPWIEILRSCHGLANARGLTLPASLTRKMARLVPEFASAEGVAPPQASSLEGATRVVQPNQSEVERFHLFDAIASFLTSVSMGAPLLLVIEDLHAADEASLHLLRVVARRLRMMSVMLLITYRETEARLAPELSELLGDLGREGTTISLRGLSEDQVAEFVQLASGVQLDESDSRTLHSATGGNPFFLAELVRLLVAEGRLVAHGLDHPIISHSVRVAIRRRVDLVADSTRRFLQTASVAGREFDLTVIRAALDFTDQQLSSAVEEAIVWGLLETLPDSIARLKFCHGLIGESLYEDLSGTERRQHHLLIAETIARLRRDELDSYLPELARHYFEALPLAEGNKAVVFSEQAAEFSLRRLAYEESVKFYRMALDALELYDPADVRRRCELLLGLGEAQCRARLFADFRHTFNKAVVLARRLNDGELLARAVLGSGMLLSDPNRSDPMMVKMLEEALVAIGAEHVLRAKLLARLAEEIRWVPARDRAMTLVDEAITIARKHDDPSTLIDALYVKLHLIRRPDNAHERLAVTTDMIEIVERYGVEYRAFDALYHRAAVLLELDDIVGYRRDINAIRALPKELRLQNIGSEVIESMNALMEGRVADSDMLAERALEIGRVRPNSTSRQIYNSQVFLIRREQGRIEEAMPARHSARSRSTPYLKATMVLYACELGRRTEAEEMFEDLASDDFKIVELDFLWFGTMACLAESCAFLGDKASAEVLHRILAPYESRNAAVGLWACYGPIAYYLGLLATTMEKYDEAEKHYEAAVRSCSKAGAALWLTRAQCGYAATLLARGCRNDRERACELLDKASSRAREQGMVALGVRASALMEAASRERDRDDATGRSRGKTVASTPTNLFHLDGDIWTITYEEQTVRLRDIKGLTYIRHLLRHPGQEFHASSLIAVDSAIGTENSGAKEELGRLTRDQLAERNLSSGGFADAGEFLDSQAKAEYARRLGELREQLEEAQEFRDEERIAAAQDEIDTLSRELSRAVDLHGRDRRANSPSERARLSVTRAIKVAIERVAKRHPSLARHLTSAIKTGTFCRYSPVPDKPVSWRF